MIDLEGFKDGIYAMNVSTRVILMAHAVIVHLRSGCSKILTKISLESS